MTEKQDDEEGLIHAVVMALDVLLKIPENDHARFILEQALLKARENRRADAAEIPPQK